MKYLSRGILYLGIVAVTLYIAVIYNSKGILLLCGINVFLPLAFWYLLLMIRGKVEYDLSFQEVIQAGSDMKKVGIEVKNNGTMPVIIKSKLLFENPRDERKHRIKVSGRVGGGEKVLLFGKWKEAELGMWRISCEDIWIYETFGWFCVRKRRKRIGTVIVLPECFETHIKVGIRTRLFFSDGEQYHPQWNGDDPSEILKLREYRDGDRMNRIHWKLSARNDMLIVKEMSLPLGCNVVFFLNTDRKKERRAYWEIVHTISAGMLEQECFHYLAWREENGEKMVRRAIRKEEDLYEFWVELPEHKLENGDLKQQYSEEFMGEQYVSYLELNEKMELFCNGAWIQRFSEEKMQEQLQEMELIL